MFIPEYTITSGILRNIASIEYNKALIEGTIIFPNWEKQLKKEANIAFVSSLTRTMGKIVDRKQIKSHIEGVYRRNSADPEIIGLCNALELAEIISDNTELGEEDLKEIYKALTNNTPQYRQSKFPEKVPPEEILAKIVEFMDWYNSLDSRDTHTIIRSGIVRAYLELLSPFEDKNSWLSGIVNFLSLKSGGYYLKGYMCVEGYLENNIKGYTEALSSIKDDDFTEWLEFYTQAVSSVMSNLKEKVMLLSKDTKVTKAAGKTELSERQARIVEYLQDYGSLQNKGFSLVFPNISEDTVLRDIKVLLDKGIIIKIGKTKNSRYELR